MAKERITLLIQPDWGSATKIDSVKYFSFPRRYLYYLIMMIVLLVVFGVAGSWTIRDNLMIRSKIKHLQASHDNLKNIANQVADIRNKERIIRDFLGIEAWNKNFDINKRMGKGGAENEDGNVPPSLNVQEEIATMTEHEPLHIRVHYLRQDIHELHQILSKMNETLKCRPTIMPVQDEAVWISSGFGWRKSPFTGLKQFHKGLDISGKRGTPLVATADGVIEKVGYNRFRGNYVNIKHDERFSTSYGHMLKYITKKGEKVERGQIVGYMGTTGMSTGYHLHYEVIDNGKKVNPYNFILNRQEIRMAKSMQ